MNPVDRRGKHKSVIKQGTEIIDIIFGIAGIIGLEAGQHLDIGLIQHGLVEKELTESKFRLRVRKHIGENVTP